MIQLLDVLSTAVFLKLNIEEGNPIFRYLLSHFEPKYSVMEILVVYKFLACCVLGLMIYKNLKHLVEFINYIFILVPVWNLIWIILLVK